MSEQLYRMLYKDPDTGKVVLEPVNPTPPELTVEEGMKLPVDTPVMKRDDDDEDWGFGYLCGVLGKASYAFIIFSDSQKQKNAANSAHWKRCRLATEQEIKDNE